MSHSNYNFQLIVDLYLNPNCEEARADVASATICNESFKLIDVSCSEGDFYFSKGFAIFCEGDQENANNGKDDEVIVWQKSHLTSLLSLASAISTQAALDALAPYNTLAAKASFGQISLINLSALSNHWLIGLIGLIGLSALSASEALSAC